jgi:hypothetical protein
LHRRETTETSGGQDPAEMVSDGDLGKYKTKSERKFNISKRGK